MTDPKTRSSHTEHTPRSPADLRDHGDPNVTAQDGRDTQIAILAGGCFWCTEAVYRALDGVIDVTSGYAGDSAATADYRTVCSGKTNHAEAIRVRFDPRRVKYTDLLEIFFKVAHDPTQLNRQGADVGRQYRSAVFYVDEAQRRETQAYIDQLDREKVFERPIVTSLEPLTEFFPAETYHQDYAARNPDQPYIRAVAAPKLDKLRHAYAERMKTKSRSAAGYQIARLDSATIARLAEPLSAEERHVLLRQGTEPPFCGTLLDNKKEGTYTCRLCGLPLFASKTKFNSGTGWPSFFAPFDPDHIEYIDDLSHGMMRTEIRCQRCGGHLGHVFPDGPPPTGQRYCLNSLSLWFTATGEALPTLVPETTE